MVYIFDRRAVHFTCGPRSRLGEDLLREVRHQKEPLLELLAGWPPECVESEIRFGQPSALLFPLIRSEVVTPLGRGQLLQVTKRAVAILLRDDAQVSCLDWRDVQLLKTPCTPDNPLHAGP